MGSIEEALAALDLLEPGERPNYTEVAKTYGVHRSTLSKRHRGVQQSREAQYEAQSNLNHQQSKQLIQWIDELTERGLPPTHEMLRNFAKEISGQKPGKNWPGRWLKSHNDKITTRYATGIDCLRKRADSAFKYSLYFAMVARKIEEYGIEPQYMYNMDEKGFLIGILQKDKRIFSRHRYELGGVRQRIQDGNRDWITAIGCICADGTALSPCLIYQAVSEDIRSIWVEDFNPREHGCFFTSSPSGWTNDELGYKWLTTLFDRETKEKAKRKWRLLFIDGHGSHITMKFINYCDANRIFLTLYPSHSTHTLQPLDVSLFGPLAKAYSNELDQLIFDYQGFCRLSKRDFFSLFWRAWGKAFTPKNIQSGWRATGLHPWDPEVVLARFSKDEDERPSSSESGRSVLAADDWRRIRGLLKEVVIDSHDKKVRKLNDTLMALSTENILLKLRCKGLEKAIMKKQKKGNRGKALMSELRAPENGGAIFYSPSKVQRARELQAEKEHAAELHRTMREEDKARRQAEKAEKTHLMDKKREEKRLNKEIRLREQEEKKRQKEDDRIARQANLQLQNDTRQAQKGKKKTNKATIIEEEENISSLGVPEALEVVPPINRRGRQLRLPQRYRDD
jgi:hypothetical protein